MRRTISYEQLGEAEVREADLEIAFIAKDRIRKMDIEKEQKVSECD